MTDTTELMVPNPYRAWLQRLRAETASDAQDMRAALDPTAAAMGGRQVWTGSVADTWTGDVGGRAQRLHQLVDRLVSEIDAAIARQPEKVPEGEARAMHNDLSHRY